MQQLVLLLPKAPRSLLFVIWAIIVRGIIYLKKLLAPTCGVRNLTAPNLKPCQAKFYCPSNSGNDTQIQCPGGFYCPAVSASPIECGVGNFCSEGATIPLPCPLSSYCASATLSSPLNCPAGYY